MSFPVYLQGPPLASQIWSTSLALKEGTSVLAKKRLMRRSAATRATKSSTTAVIAGLPPRRSYNDFGPVAICSPVVAQPTRIPKLSTPIASRRFHCILRPPVPIESLCIGPTAGTPPDGPAATVYLMPCERVQRTVRLRERSLFDF